jgi:hypothetical protein
MTPFLQQKTAGGNLYMSLNIFKHWQALGAAAFYHGWSPKFTKKASGTQCTGHGQRGILKLLPMGKLLHIWPSLQVKILHRKSYLV